MRIMDFGFTALLPMKGHSERVTNKNLKLFAGKPLFHAIVNSLMKSKYVDNIVVNTDSEAIKDDINRNFPDITIIDRPIDICGDYVSMNTIIAHDLTHLTGKHFMQTHSTNPLLTNKTIDRAFELFIESKNRFDSIFSVSKLQSRFFWKNGKPVNHEPSELLRTQDLEPIFEENSNFYFFTRDSFAKSGNRRIGVKPKMFEIDKVEAIDIDDVQDFIIAESIFRSMQKV